MIKISICAYLIKKNNINVTSNEIIITKTVNLNPSFKLNSDKILTLFQENACENLNEDLCGELTIDGITWQNILDNLIIEDYTKEELSIIEKISQDIADKEMIQYECF